MRKTYKNAEEFVNETTKTNVSSLSKAIKARCLYCSNYSYAEVKECRVTDCPLWKFRNGHKPKNKELN